MIHQNGNSLVGPVPLSQSELWQVQRNFFAEQGAEVWKQNMVPRYITSNPFIAHAYARIVLAYLKDHFAGAIEQGAGNDAEQPIFILELGAGSGQFSYHFLRQFLQFYDASLTPGRKVRYVMTDASAKILAYWQAVEQFQPYIEQGVLDFACFDARRDDTLKLLISGQSVGLKKSSGPLIVIANYLFDCMPQDVFEVIEGRLYECPVTVEAMEPRAGGEVYGESEAIELSYHSRPCADAYYRNESWNLTLSRYLKIAKDGAFLFPVGAVQCLENLRALAPCGLLMLSGDKGQHQLDLTLTQDRPEVNSHGRCFTFDVNYFALSEHVRQTGGQVWHTPHNPKKIDVLAFLYGEKPKSTCQLSQAYLEYVSEFGPDNFFTVKKLAEENQMRLSLEEIISLLRLSRHDAAIISCCYERLMQILPGATACEREGFYTELRAAAERCFVIDRSGNPFQMGNLLAVTEHYEEALASYRRSQIEAGNSASTEFNLALTYLNLGKRDEARSCLAKALALDEDLMPAQHLLNKIDRWSRVELSKDATASNGQSILSHLEESAFIRAQLNDQRLRLEPLLPVHAQALFEQATSEIMCRARLPVFSCDADALGWIRLTVTEADNYSFAIMHHSSGFGGVISVTVVEQTGQFFFWLGKPFWGQGLATAAMCRLLRFVFEELGLEEMLTCVRADNHASLRVLQKLGFSRFGAADQAWLNFRRGLSQFTFDEIKNSTCRAGQHSLAGR
jgi:RimJ/RimL family protein N-acetyltransferase